MPQIEDRRRDLLIMFSKPSSSKDALHWLNKLRKISRLRKVEKQARWAYNQKEVVIKDVVETLDDEKSPLSKWMRLKIKNDFKWNKEVTPQDIEIFLVKQLKKNSGKIKTSHIRNRFWSNSDEMISYFENLFKDFDDFEIIYQDKVETKTTNNSKKKKQGLLFGLSNDVKELDVKDERKILLLDLWKKLSEVEHIQDKSERVKIYSEIIWRFSKDFWYTINKEQFENSLLRWFLDVWSENLLKKKLRIMIDWWKWREWPTERHWYWRIKLEWSNWQRIVAYPNKEIVALLWHDDYIKFITTKPNSQKR